MLALVDEAPKHGFAVAALTAETGELGRAWHLPRPIVYRAVTRLTDLGLVRVQSTEPGQRGPQRSVLAVTGDGAGQTDRWLREPVPHVRDVRSALLAKLALLARRGRDPRGLLADQRAVFTPIEAALQAQRVGETEFSHV
ncbi:MAG: helix-turn-helix transcriptional regulator [Actinomycetota bacterium]|nr:helix-turn-helix transcriptional regulator [Actinomycetota bacterium]